MSLGLTRFLTVLTGLMLISAPVYALPSDRDQPIYVAADSAMIDENKGITIYTGSVEITQGSMILRGDRVELYRGDNGDVDQVIATGTPAYFEQQPDSNSAITKATGKRLDYQVTRQMMVISEEARVEQAGDRFTGARIEYDMDKALVEAFSDGSSGQRVRMVIQPKSEAAQ